MATPLRWNRPAVAAAVAALMGLAVPGLIAQERNPHRLYDSRMPPGAIGQTQVFQRGGAMRGYYQPVQIYAPSGAKIALAAEGRFGQSAQKVLGGFLLGCVYRLRVTEIPEHEGQELFPTLELIDRTYPPPGRAWQFPVMVELSQQDMELALQGKYVTRVVYLEAPRQALPSRTDPEAQEWFDSGKRDPLAVADDLGRPIAILRMGSRAPEDVGNPGMKFLHGCPPYQLPPAEGGEKKPPPAGQGNRQASFEGTQQTRPAPQDRPWQAR